MGRLIGVYSTNGGFVSELVNLLGRMSGFRNCKLRAVTHSLLKKKSEWKRFEDSLRSDGYEFALVHKNKRTDAQLRASAGREPCVLIEYEDFSLGMVLDWEDLAASKGNVRSFERILKSKLVMY